MLSARCVSCVLLCLIFFGLFQFEFLQFSSILLDGWIWRVFGFSLKLGLGFVGDLHMWVCWAFDILLCSDLFLLLHKIKSNTDSLSNCPTWTNYHSPLTTSGAGSIYSRDTYILPLSRIPPRQRFMQVSLHAVF